ncbi:hypothetical protein DSO57_1006510 [Entomophthora muscae]|uniref:Uncharacterized protein n=1 Tax=Entomophthora muscae TaxID=34485 RepID=A0ACC2S9R2_9FUNG|nr:hypothetical protein DSO57_1006510 [Entomophthora muscae]
MSMLDKDTFDAMNMFLEEGLVNPMDMYFTPELVYPPGFEFRVQDATPGGSPARSNALPLLKVPMSFGHSPLASPLHDFHRNMMFLNSATASPTYTGWGYESRRSSTPACFTESNQGDKPFRRASVTAARRRSVNKAESSKVFNCSEEGCTKVFKRNEHLKRHMKSIHSDEKPYHCPFPDCDKRFSRADNLSQHLRIHRDPSDKIRSKGFTSNTPYVLPACSDFVQLDFPQ